MPPGECGHGKAWHSWRVECRVLPGWRGGARCERLHHLQQDDGRALLRRQRQWRGRAPADRGAEQQAGSHGCRLRGGLRPGAASWLGCAICGAFFTKASEETPSSNDLRVACHPTFSRPKPDFEPPAKISLSVGEGRSSKS